MASGVAYRFFVGDRKMFGTAWIGMLVVSSQSIESYPARPKVFDDQHWLLVLP